jgi:hypothetical protein
MYTWVTISGMLAVFFAPISGLMVASLTLRPAMRVLYLISCASIFVRIVLQYIYSHETGYGRARMESARAMPFFAQLRGYGGAFRAMLNSRETVTVLALMTLLSVGTTVINNFFSLFVTAELGIPEPLVAYFPMVRAIVMLFFIFIVPRRLSRVSLRVPMMTGLILYIAGHVMLLLSPYIGKGLLAGYILCEALGYALVIPRKDSLYILCVDPRDRALTMSLISVAMLAITAPFGWIAGLLSGISRLLPFILNIVLYILCFVLLLRAPFPEDDSP